jgi:hypothetical protein
MLFCPLFKKFKIMEIIGKIIKVMPLQTGTGKNGEWKKQEFIVEIAGTYPKKVAITVWGDRTADLQSLPLGQEVKAFVDVESREYNERWYTDVKAWKLEKVMTGSINPSAPQSQNNENNGQSANVNVNTVDNNPFGDSPDFKSEENTGDDLPF